jgi:hypothetical protein
MSSLYYIHYLGIFPTEFLFEMFVSKGTVFSEKSSLCVLELLTLPKFLFLFFIFLCFFEAFWLWIGVEKVEKQHSQVNYVLHTNLKHLHHFRNIRIFSIVYNEISVFLLILKQNCKNLSKIVFHISIFLLVLLLGISKPFSNMNHINHRNIEIYL